MSPRTCDYVAKKSDPESWHGTGSSTFYVDRSPTRGGLGTEEWHCPHPPLDRDDSSDDAGNNQYCVFHTDPADVPNDINESEALLDALQNAGNSPRADRPEHRGQFVGATFKALDLSGETVTATDHHDVRFDHAKFESNDSSLDFRETKFVTEGNHPISFAGTEFIATEGGHLLFHGAMFRSDGEGYVRFPGATFRTDGKGDVAFGDATFRTDGKGDVRFSDTTFQADCDGNVWFQDATFRTNDEGQVRFPGAVFRTVGKGHVKFVNTTFRTHDMGDVVFRDTTFRTHDMGDVKFHHATFRTNDEGQVRFRNARFQTEDRGDIGFRDAMFRKDGNGDVRFRDVILTDVDFRWSEFAGVDLGGVDLTGTDLRGANVEEVAVNGSTTCQRLNEGYTDNRMTGRLFVPARLKRLYQQSQFEPDDWDATAQAYHQMKTVFSGHGLIGRARNMHIRERRSRSYEAKAKNGWTDRRYLRSLPSRLFTGYGVQVQNLALWMVILFLFSTIVYVTEGVEDTLTNNISYSVLAFTVAPPEIPSKVWVQLVMMVETFFGTLSIVLLGYILGNRERF